MTRLDIISVGILTVSDRAFSGQYQDSSGPKIIHLLRQQFKNPLKISYLVVADERSRITNALRKLARQEKCSLIFTTGGTGPGKRDVTPEATETLCTKILPGFGEAMRRASFPQTPTAILSRQTAGIYNKSLLVNFPGNPEAITVCFAAVMPALSDCLEVLDGPEIIYRDQKLNTHHHKEK